MKRILLIGSILLLLPLALAQPVTAQPGDITFSIGVMAPYDVSEGESGVGWQMTYAVGVTEHLELGAMFSRSGNYEAENDLTTGEVEVSTLLIQGRWMVNPGDVTRCFVDLGAGMMDVNPKGPSVTENRPGAAARIGLGLDHNVGPVDLRLGIGYTKGIGRTSEIDMMEASISILFGSHR